MADWQDQTTSKNLPRIAVVGCGAWGRNLVRNFAQLGALAAIVEVDQAAAKSLSMQFNCDASSLDDALSDPRIDAVVIAAPAAQHYNIGKRALYAGKHVYVEKPLALKLDEAHELCQIAERLDRRLMVGHLLQYHPVFLELKRFVREGLLGRIQYLYSNRLNLGKIRREEDVMWSFAPHDISMILSLVGSEPDFVNAVGSYHLHDSIADVTMLQLGFPSGERAHVFVSWLHPFKEQKFVLVGTEAMAVFDDTESWDKKLLLYPHKVAWKDNLPLPSKADGIPMVVAQKEPLAEECLHFLECIVSGATPRTDGREGTRVLSVLAQATASLSHARQASSSSAGTVPYIVERNPRVRGTHSDVMVHESAYLDSGVTIGAGTKIWHFSHVLSDVIIGEKCSLGQNVVVGPNVTIGNGVKIQNNVSIYEGVTLCDDVFCGPSCVFTNVTNPRSSIVRKHEYKSTLVKRGASIGANATVVCGNTIGEYSLVAAGAVVTTDVPDYALMAGVPARRIGWISKAGGRLGPDLVCPIDGTQYKEDFNGKLTTIEG